MEGNIDLNLLAQLTDDLTPIPDMALLLDVDEGQLRIALSEHGSDAWRVYHRHKAEAARIVRRRNIELAEAGSPTAAEAVNGYLATMSLEES